RDLVFILPQNQEDTVSLRRPGVIGEPSFVPAPDDVDALPPPAPFCAYGPGTDDDAIGVVFRVADCHVKLPLEGFSLKGSCTDVSSIVGRCSYPPVQAFFLATFPEHYARVYEDLFFR